MSSTSPFNQDSRANLVRKIGYFLFKRPNINLVLSRLRNRRARGRVPILLEQAFPGEIRPRRTSPRRASPGPSLLGLPRLSFRSRQPLFRSMASATFRVQPGASAAGCEISTDGRVYFPHSLGIFYQALTQYLGFPHYGDEYKVMGLAPYGTPTFMDSDAQDRAPAPRWRLRARSELFSAITARTSLISGRTVRRNSATCFRPRSKQLLGPRRDADDPLEDRHRDIARSAQAMYEEAFFHLLGALAKTLRTDRPRAGRRLRDEFRRQRQGAAA